MNKVRAGDNLLQEGSEDIACMVPFRIFQMFVPKLL